MNEARPPRALIVGGSLGGLFAATTLRAIGWDVQVFERSISALDSRGGGIVLQPDVLAAFRFAGIDRTKALGVRSGDRIYLDASDEVIERAFMPQTQTSWNMLHGLLSRALPPALVHRGETLVGFDQEESSVRARFASGRIERGDLLVGADGPRSTVRELLLPDALPRYAGYVAWRGLAPERLVSDRAKAKLEGTFSFQQGKDFLLLAYLVPGEDESTAPGHRRWNWVWYRRSDEGADFDEAMTDAHGRRRQFSIPPGSMAARSAQALREAASRLLAPTFADLVDATQEPFVQAILDLEISRMVFDRVVLVGDAAFIARPHTAGSTAKAAANAVALAEALASSPNIDLSLGDWGGQQIQVGLDMTARGRVMGDRIMGIFHAARRHQMTATTRTDDLP